MQMKTALFPGSFDPFTRGHEALVGEALRLFDRVVVGIGHHPSKRGLLAPERRLRLVEELYAGEPRVEARLYTGLTGDFAREIGATALVRGVRNALDLAYEQTLEATNRRLWPDLTTVLLCPPGDVRDIASSTVRELLAYGHDVGAFLPERIRIENYLTDDKR